MAEKRQYFPDTVLSLITLRNKSMGLIKITTTTNLSGLTFEYYEKMNPANGSELGDSDSIFLCKKYFKVVLAQPGELAVWRLHNREILQCATELQHCSCGHGTKKGGENFFPSCRHFKKN
jgi:hypothetical protein